MSQATAMAEARELKAAMNDEARVSVERAAPAYPFADVSRVG